MIITRGKTLRKQYFSALFSKTGRGKFLPLPSVPVPGCYWVGIISVASTLALIQ